MSAPAPPLQFVGAKLAFSKAGSNGATCRYMVQSDLTAGALVKITVEVAPRPMAMAVRAVYRKDTPQDSPGTPSSRSSDNE